MANPTTPTPREGDSSAKNRIGQLSVLGCSDAGQTLRLLADEAPNGGVLRTSLAGLTVPPAATEVDTVASGDVSSQAGVDTNFTIPDGDTLTIQVFQAGAEGSNDGSTVELFDDPNGDLSSLLIIGQLFAAGSSSSQIIDEDFLGDGVRRIVMRRRTFTSGNREIFARWRGFLNT